MAKSPTTIKRVDPGIVEPAFDVDDIAAMQACVRGNASPQQAKRAIDWVMAEAARVHDMSFQLGGEEGRRLTDFAEGRRYVGHQIRRLLQPETLRLLQEKVGDRKASQMADKVAESLVPPVRQA